MKKLITSSNTLWSCLIAMVMMMASQSAWAEYVKLTALSGTGGTGGEGYASLVDTKDGRDGRPATKWGQWTNFGEGGKAWLIVKAEKAFAPTNYFLVTANDTNGNQGRQWTGWNIYGANFESDADATMNAEAWVLIDQREDADVSMQKFGLTQFALNDAESLAQYDGTPYQYYMIEVTAMKTDGQYLQMGEFGFGTYADFQTWVEIQAADPTKPLSYRIIAGTRNNGENEGLSKLFDGNTGTKFGNSLNNVEEGQYKGLFFIIKVSRPIAPTYYSLTTANDTGPSGNRNWKQWQIYAMDANSDAEVTRESSNWVAIDKKYNVGKDQLPAANFTQAFFDLSEGNTKAYKYFKVEIDQICNSGDYAQMSEFALGDEYTFAIERNVLIESLGYDPNLFAEKALLDQMSNVIADIQACDSPKELENIKKQANKTKDQINVSANKYAELTTARNMALNQIADDDVADAVLAYVNGWISETDAIAPCEDYPIGNFAYIKANRQATGEEASAEAKRFSAVLLSNTKKVPDPIGSVGYVFIAGTTDNWQPTESPAQLIDGDRDGTKWGCGTGGDRWLVFKAKEPIKPTYYGLVTGGDTHVYTDRNWKNWKIWGANFESDEEATKNAAGWVLIDEKNNVGTDVLKTTSLFESYINLSIGCSEPYKYFKIEVYHQGGMQMNEFTFYNMGDLVNYRESFVADFEGYDPLENPAYKGYTDAYAEKYEELKTTVNAPDVMKLKNEMIELQEEIATSVELYDEYEAVYDELVKAKAASESLQAWFDGYTQENIAPNNIYRNGTYKYIMENCPLDNKAMGNRQYLYDSSDSQNDTSKKFYDRYKYEPGTGEIGFVENMIFAKEKGQYILVDGHTDDQWGDGYHGNLVDSYFLNDTVAAGDTIINNVTYQLYRVKLGTKWGGNSKGADNTFENTYVIFRTLGPTNPFFYTLTTGDDTANNQNRNWGTWYIYGGNFDGDGNATKDADGWELIDIKENIGQDRLHPVNCQPSYFGFSSETTKEYTYYKVVVTKAFKDTQIQMNDLHFGTPEEFEAIQQAYMEKANEFEYDIVAEQALIDQYEDAVAAIDKSPNMEALFRANYDIEELQKKITESAKVYVRYEQAVNDVKAFLEANNLDESEAKTVLVNYLNEVEEPSELYPNGSAEYILDVHVLADSVVIDEIDFMESLKVAAVLAGYSKGLEITPLIVNPTFAKAGEMQKDEKGNNLGRVAEGWDGYIFRSATDSIGSIYAAEFCNENAKFDVSQTLTEMKNGYYKVKLNAAYRANGDLLSFNYAPMAYTNSMQTFIPVIREEAIQEEEEAWKGIYPDRVISYYEELDSIFVGWGMWGCEGAANAFTKGLYEITMVAEVTDGNLTFGLKNEGIKGNEWTGAGNFRLWYLGETADDAADAFAEVAAYNAKRIETLTETYAPNAYDDNYADAPGFAAVQRELLDENSGVPTLEAAQTIGETMQDIYETKKAYGALFEAQRKVNDKWLNQPNYESMEEDVDKIKENLQEGKYEDAAAAYAAADSILAAYPDYMEVQAYNDNGALDVALTDEPFTYEAFSYGRNPALLIGGDFYDELEKDEVIFAFAYTSTEELPDSRFYIGKDADDTQKMDIAIPAAKDLTQIYINLTEAVENWGFGKTDDVVRWRLASGESNVEVVISRARMITKAQMKAEGGKAINDSIVGDLNGDEKVDIADAVTVLNIMAASDYNEAADVNNDEKVDIADFVTILNIMAAQ